MSTPTITGSGRNHTVTLALIHAGKAYFYTDTSTTHSQVKLMQEALTNLGFNTQGNDGKFGKNTLSAVKSFQSAKGLTVDGKFGKNSLNALETEIGHHLDPANCTSPIAAAQATRLTAPFSVTSTRLCKACG